LVEVGDGDADVVETLDVKHESIPSVVACGLVGHGGA
jgi:hypothetical protein